MKIKEITESNYKVTQSDPEKVEISSADGATKITTTPAAIQSNPNTPNISTLNLNPANQPQGQQQGNTTMGQPVANGQQPQVPPEGQPTNGQPQQGPIPVVNGQQPANGQAPQPGQPAPQQQMQLPKVGSEIELPDDIGSTMQSETVDDVDDEDLMASGHNKDISGDPTDKFINDVVDKEFEKHAGKSQRNVVQPNPIRESEELIAMLTIAGLR
jgi:hypothetical protein